MKARKPDYYWVGVDEAGYGPSMGPLVMTAVVAHSKADTQPDIWQDLEGVSRCRPLAPGAKLIVDDSKAVMARADGMQWLEQAFAAIADTIHVEAGELEPSEFWRQAFGPEVFGGKELALWQDDLPGLKLPQSGRKFRLQTTKWRICAAQVRVVGPSEFNSLLGDPPNKAVAHGLVFRDLMTWLQGLIKPGDRLRIVSDRHGGRKFYYDLIMDCFPGCWVHKVSEKQELSRYKIDTGEISAEIDFRVEADASNGLVALASMVSKYLREQWMQEQNAWFARRVPGLRPTAGYPVDAKRFAGDVREFCDRAGIRRETWWRLR
jgi:ribonuclease HII